MMRSLITKFIKDDAGAVTVDFVVLTAVALSFTVGVYKWFVVDPDKSSMMMVIVDGEVKQTIMVADNGVSKMMATAQFHVSAFVSCIFGQNPEVGEAAMGQEVADGAVCRYILGS
jgi:hypothetical protein